MELETAFQGRGLEAIKGQRRKASHKQAVLDMLQEMRQREEASEDEEVDGPQPQDGARSESDEKLLEFVEALGPIRSQEFSAQALSMVCANLREKSNDRILEEISLYLLQIFPLPEDRAKRGTEQPLLTSRRKARRAEYARVQEMYKKNPGKCMRKLLKDKATAESPPQEVMFPFWRQVMTACSNVTPGTGRREEAKLDLWSPIMPNEIKKALPSRGTAPGPDGLTARLLGSVPCEILLRVFNIFMICGKVPKHLLESRTTLIPKKDGADQPGDFRPITVSSVLLRTYHKILATRIMKHVVLDPRQKAFRQVDGCSENVFLLDMLLRCYREQFKPLFIASIDVAKAFDSVTHQAINDTLLHLGVPEVMVEYIMYSYRGSCTRLVCSDWVSELIFPKCGVKQGDPLSPVIFNMIIDRLFKLLPKEIGARVGCIDVSAEAFADDLFLAASTEQGLQQLINIMADYLASCGLAVNAQKCFTVSLRNVPREKKSVVDSKTTFQCLGRKLPALSRTSEWKYLGVPFTPQGRSTSEPVAKLQEAINILSKAPLKPQQKLFGLRVMVLPGLYHELTLGRTKIGTLKKLDTLTRVTVRRWLNLPHDCVSAYVHASVKDGGMSIPSFRWTVPLRRMKRLKALAKTRPEDQAEPFLEKEIEHAANRLNDNGRFLDSAVRVEKRWANLLHNSVDGAPLKNSRKVPSQHRWVIEGNKFVSGKDYLNMMKLRINALPVRARTTRGRTADRTCRAGCRESETLHHVLQRCHRTHGTRITRHDAVASYVERSLRKREYEVTAEPQFRVDGALRKPDLVAVKGVTALVIDAQVVGEQENLRRAHRRKIEYYEDLKDIIKQRHHVENVVFTSITLTSRGLWSQDSAEDLVRFDIIRKGELKVISTRVLIGGLQGFWMFNRSTATTRRRQGIG